MRLFFLVLCLITSSFVESVFAVEPETSTEPVEEVSIEEVSEDSYFYSEAYSQPERVFAQYSAMPVRKNTFTFNIDHRNQEGIARKPFDQFLGFDGGSLKVGLGLRYGILDDLDVGLMRMNGTSESWDTYEIDARYRFLRQERFLVHAAVRAGVTWFSQDKRADAVGYFAQLLVSRLLFDRFHVGTSLVFHSDSSHAQKLSSDQNATLAMTFFGEARFTDLVGFSAELAQPVALYSASKIPQFTVGPKFYTNRHTFAVVLSNTQSLTTDSLITGQSKVHSDIRDWVLGFNITREL